MKRDITNKPEPIKILLTKSIAKKLQPLFDYAQFESERGQPGMILSQPLQDDNESWISFGYVENKKAAIIVAVTELELK